MSRDARNSIILWAGTLAFVGVFWALLHFEVAANLPDRWLWPTVGILVGANVVKAIRDYVRRRNARARSSRPAGRDPADRKRSINGL